MAKSRNRKLNGMILAAGRGERLRPLTSLRAKPAVPFLNRPLVTYAAELLESAGVQEFVVNLHHLPQTVVEALEPFRGRITFSREQQILGTAGALRPLRERLQDSTTLLINGKIFFEDTLEKALDFHYSHESCWTMVLIPHRGEEPFNPVFVDRESTVVGFAGLHQNPEGRNISEGIFTGIHILEPDFLDYLPEGPSDSVRDVYPRLTADGRRVLGFFSDAYWCECSTPRRYLEKSMEVLRRKGLSLLSSGSLSYPFRECVLGDSFQAGEDVEMSQCIAWDDVQVGRGCRLRRTILLTGARVPIDTILSDSIVTAADSKSGGTSPIRIFPLEEERSRSFL